MKKRKSVATFSEVKFVFDEFSLSVKARDKHTMNYMGLPLTFVARGKTLVVVDMAQWLNGIVEKVRTIYKENQTKV